MFHPQPDPLRVWVNGLGSNESNEFKFLTRTLNQRVGSKGLTGYTDPLTALV